MVAVAAVVAVQAWAVAAAAALSAVGWVVSWDPGGSGGLLILTPATMKMTTNASDAGENDASPWIPFPLVPARRTADNRTADNRGM